MQRRTFLQSTLSASALAVSGTEQGAQAQTPNGREYYELRQYKLENGPQGSLTHSYLEKALIPALNRMGMNHIGAFNLYLGPETPVVYVLIPSNSLDGLVTAELKLSQDEEYQKAGSAFIMAKEPPYQRVESQLLIAFEGHPKLTVPPATEKHAARVFQLRTYESPTNFDHRNKVEMFHKGEFDYFQKAGFWQVFYGDALIGSRMPHLTYMLSFPDLGAMEGMWNNFVNDPDWKKLSSNPTYTMNPPNVSNIDSLILKPTGYSQI